MVLDVTVAGANANSYITVAEADAFAAADPVSGEPWLKAADAEKERALIAAASDVDLYQRASGTRFDASQALLYPRLVDASGTPAVPFLLADVKRAAYEQAAYLLQHARLIADAAARRARALYSASDDDGSSTIALNPSFGLYAPKMMERLDRIGSGERRGARIVSVPLTSSYEASA